MTDIAGNRKLARFEYWLSDHVNQAAICIVVIGILIYIHYAFGYYLNPDEASHVIFADRRTLREAYRASHNLAHPPLMIMVLHLWLELGKSVLVLRLLSAVLCAGALWFAFKWIRLTYGPIEAIVGMLFLAFSPAMISSAVEVRQYALLLFFICGALYFLQRFLISDSLWAGFLYSVFLYGAVLTHYSAFLVVVAFGIYASILILRKKHGAKIKGLWGMSQVGVIGLYIFLYFTHIRWMIDSGFAQQQIQGYLKRGYFSPGRETITSFIAGKSLDFFTYIAGGRLAGIVALICFVLGVASIRLKRPSDPPPASERYHSFLLVLPFIIGCAGGIVRIYPFEGSRQVSYLLPFAAAGVALCFVRLFPLKRLWLALAAGVILVPTWLLAAQPPPNVRLGMSDAHMQAALAQLNKNVPASALLVVDDMTHYVLAFYLGGDHFRSHEFEGRMGKYRFAWSKSFAFSPDNFERELAAISASQHVKAGDFVWVMTVGRSDAEKFKAFLAAYPRKRVRELWNFGPITIFQIKVL